MNPAATEAATREAPISRVAPEVRPAGGGIVDDSQAGDTSPGSGSTLGGGSVTHTAADPAAAPGAGEHPPTFKDKVEGFAKVMHGKAFDNPAQVEFGKAKLDGRI